MKRVDITEIVNYEEYKGDKVDNFRLGHFYKNQKKYSTMKWEQYLPVYERIFAPFIVQRKPVNMLEIGVQNGGSLNVWNEYLPAGSQITGIDVEPLCANLEYPSSVKMLVGDATKQEFIDEHLSKSKFDIIIDDGSHVCADVIKTFEMLFSKLKPGGIYVVEDCHTSYWNQYFGGGLRAKTSSMEYFKKLLDAINYKYILDSEITEAIQAENLAELNTEIASISFYDSLIVIEKYLTKRTAPFRNYATQGISIVVPERILDPICIRCDENTLFEKIYNR